MILSDWRKTQRLTLRECGERLGLSGKNPARAYQRIETGEHHADADIVEAIGTMTMQAVTEADMHRTRLAFLQSRQTREAAE